VAAQDLAPKVQLALLTQNVVSRLMTPITIPVAVFVMRFVYKYRIENAKEVRRKYREILRDNRKPLLICANHLTMVDSFLICWALGSGLWYFFKFSALPWHVPERTNFAAKWYHYFLIYIVKSIPIERGGSRREVSRVLKCLIYLLAKGHKVMIFPEAGRSRTGRVNPENAAQGVGRILGGLPGCRTLIVYLRGEHQETWSEMPVQGEVFHAEIDLIEPKSDLQGMRKSRELAQKVTTHLKEMEDRYFAGRQ